MATPSPQPILLVPVTQLRTATADRLGVTSLDMVIALDALADALALRYAWLGIPPPVWLLQQRVLLAAAIADKRPVPPGGD